MIDFLNLVLSQVNDNANNKFLNKIKFYSICRFIIKKTANICIPVFFQFSQKKKFTITDGQKVYVSLTSFPARINKLWIVIESILRQKRPPDKVILWLSKNQFPSLDVLPKKLLRLQKRNLEIVLVDDDLRSHKKHYYFLKRFPDDLLITIDDDIIYPSTTISDLLLWHKKFPEAVIARYGWKIKRDGDTIKPYRTWENEYHQALPDNQIFFGSGGGTLFPAHSLAKMTTDKELFLNLCPYADDIWLNTMCRLAGTKIFRISSKSCSTLAVTYKIKHSLSARNVFNNENDTQLESVRNYFLNKEGVDPYKL